MSIQFSEKLQEKMEFTISQYIGELHEAGIIEKIKEYYEMHRFHLKYDVYIINALFDDTSPKYNKVRTFNRAANDYFNEEDKNELQKYYNDYCTNIRWSKKRQDKWLEDKNVYYMYMIGYICAKQNKSFIMEQIECISSNVMLK
jgi:hypothetical protein